MMEIKVHRFNPSVIFPRYGTADSAGIDVFPIYGGTLYPGYSTRIPLGINFEFPKGYYALIKDRSSWAIKGVHVLGGVIDADYRGEYSAVLHNLDDEKFTYDTDTAIAQVLILPLIKAKLTETEVIPMNTGVHRGYGSTNVDSHSKNIERKKKNEVVEEMLEQEEEDVLAEGNFKEMAPPQGREMGPPQKKRMKKTKPITSTTTTIIQ